MSLCCVQNDESPVIVVSFEGASVFGIGHPTFILLLLLLSKVPAAHPVSLTYKHLVMVR